MNIKLRWKQSTGQKCCLIWSELISEYMTKVEVRPHQQTMNKSWGIWCRGRLQEYYNRQTAAVPIVAGLSAKMLQTI